MEELVGRTLDGTYRIEQVLGKGGMGAVYRAHDISLNRDVAIKVMHAHLTEDEGFRARFLQEARAVAALDHPGIVEIHAFGQDLGMLYIVMDFVAGQTLDTWLRRLAQKRQIIALAESLTIVRQIALALYYAHEKGVLHRDVKPANILLKPTEPTLREPGELPFRPILTDFGLAKLMEGGVRTQTGTSMGTPAYMSPEQCLGLEADRRADVYSLGVVLFELATGRIPFEVRSLTDAIRHHTQEPPPPPRSLNATLPIEVENIILRALAKDRQHRYDSGREMADALSAAIPHIPTGMTVTPTQADGPAPSQDAGSPPDTGPGAPPYVSLMTRLVAESIALGPPPSKEWKAVPPDSQPGDALIVVLPGRESRRVPLGERRVLTVGRTDENDVQLSDQDVSRHHAQIAFDGKGWAVTDLNSTNGTFLGSSRLLPGVRQPWPQGMPLRVGAHWLRFAVQTTPSESSVAQGVQRHAVAIAVALEPEALTVEAGQSVVARLSVLNEGVQVAHLAAEIDGIPRSWITTPDESLRLNPNEEIIVPITFHPPREPHSIAGPYPFSLYISGTDDRLLAQASGTCTVLPFHAFELSMSPQQTTRQARLTLSNQGNAPTQLTIAGTDPAKALHIQATPAQVTLQPGVDQIVPLEAVPKQRPWLGVTQRYPFEVAVALSTGKAIRQSGTLVVHPRIPAWVIPALGLLLILLCTGTWIGYQVYIRTVDADQDRLAHANEIAIGTDPRRADTDGDGLADGDEIAQGTNPLAVDSDGDTLLDGREVHDLGTSPINPDTDGDGINDNIDPDPAAPPTPTPTPMPTGTPEPTPVAIHTTQPTATQTPTAVPTATQAPTVTPMPGPTHTPPPVEKRIAYIHDGDLNSAEAYQYIIQQNLDYVTVDILPMSQVIRRDLSQYAGLIASWDSGRDSTWGDQETILQIMDSGKPILGIHRGGWALFGEMGLQIGYPNGSQGSKRGLYVPDPDNIVYKQPHPVSVPSSRQLDVYPNDVPGIAISRLSASGNVEWLGQEVGSDEYYVVVRLDGRYTLWGFGGPSNGMTSDGQSLFLNLVQYMISSQPN